MISLSFFVNSLFVSDEFALLSDISSLLAMSPFFLSTSSISSLPFSLFFGDLLPNEEKKSCRRDVDDDPFVPSQREYTAKEAFDEPSKRVLGIRRKPANIASPFLQRRIW